jgi:hypothetical protein
MMQIKLYFTDIATMIYYDMENLFIVKIHICHL